ncbi:MAG: glycosyltransferase [Paenibacillaceae bacterium]
MSTIINNGVTIITPTIRPTYIRNVFTNYSNQRWSMKELIILLNKDSMNYTAYQRMASKYPNVRVFKLSERYSLGECLNYAVRRAKYNYIAKFDDDDYYGPNYIPEAMRLFKRTKADIVGKKSYYLYFPHRRTLMLRRSSARPYGPCGRIAGATIIFRRKLFNHVKFIKAAHGTDARFLSTCLKRGFSMYSTSRYHFAAIRRSNVRSHTWTISERELLTESNKQIIRTKYYKKYVNRSN